MQFIAILSSLLLAQAYASPTASRVTSDSSRCSGSIPEPPNPETIELSRFPLPPAISDYTPGACSEEVNPLRTGCMPVDSGRSFQSGGFLPDGRHVLALIHFVGAPLAPEPGSSYNGSQIIIVKTDDSTFGNGEKWKCLTCGVPGVPNTAAVNATEEHLGYPEAFDDGKRALVGTYILDCGDHDLASEECTTERMRLLPLHWNTSLDGSGASGSMRELRLHPDNVHLGFSSFTEVGGKLGQLGFYGRLQYNASPTTGLPLAPRYDVVNVNVLFDPTSAGPIETDGTKLTINHQAITVGELRGFSGPGDEVIYVGYPSESSNLDLYAVSLDTGKVRRVTRHPEYVDPVDGSRDGKWWAIMDTRDTDRQMFLAGMRGIPPVTDLVSSSVTSATRNNGFRRFFVPYVLDNAGDRGSYYGQKVNGPGFGELGGGGLNDPQWNGQADPKWCLDSTQLVYWEAQAKSPACGGTNPLSCYPSSEPGGRDVRMILAKFPDRVPSAVQPVATRPDTIPWALPYVPGGTLPDRPSPEEGAYTLEAEETGSADVVITKSADGSLVQSVAVTYHDYSDDGKTFLTGYENVTIESESPTLNLITWFSNLTQSTGETFNTKLTSPDGFRLSIDVLINVFDAQGTISTTIDGTTYEQPLNGA